MASDNDSRSDFDKLFPSNNHFEPNPYDCYTTSALEDALTSILSSKNECQVNKETNQIVIKWEYLDYAEKILYRMNVFKPAPIFEISLSDIPRKLKETLSGMDEKSLNTIFTNVVRRILDSVNPAYYHTNGVHRKVKWGTVD